MRNTVKGFLLIGAILCTPLFTFGQSESEGNNEQRLQRLAERLELTEEQIVEMKIIMERHAEKIKTHSDEVKETREQMRTELAEVLTEEQMIEFKRMMEAHHGRTERLARRGQGHDQEQAQRQSREERHLERLSRALELSDEQKAEIEAILEAHRASEERDREELEEHLKRVLTPEQSAKFDEISQRMRHR